MDSAREVEEIEICLLLEAILRRYGYDFRDYAPASLKRRILKCMRDENLSTLSGLQERVLHDPACMKRFLNTLTVDVTALFRDPGFYLAFRRHVVPLLRTYAGFRVWHAGCASGEEVYSMAILLREEGILQKARIYATDLNEDLVNKAKEGIFPLSRMKEYTRNYQAAGGKGSLSDYYVARYDNAIMEPSMKENLTFAVHNLACDGSFNEFHVVLCRNVMIYFNRKLQERVHRLLYESLGYLGTLAVGSKESLKFTPHETDYDAVDESEKIYRKVR
ncbi:MAG: protein-glutamate O-methyltransferase CheR [Thermodesulfobacteriota bacterium]